MVIIEYLIRKCELAGSWYRDTVRSIIAPFKRGKACKMSPIKCVSEEDYVPFLKILFWVLGHFKNVPYKLDESSQRLESITCKGYRVIYNLQLLIQLLYTLAMTLFACLSYFKGASSMGMTFGDQMVGTFFLSGYLVGSVPILTLWAFENRILWLVNGAWDFEQEHLMQLLASRLKYRKGNRKSQFIFLLGLFVIPFVPFTVFCLLLFKPCTPPFLLPMITSMITSGTTCNCVSLMNMDGSVLYWVGIWLIRLTFAIFDTWMISGLTAATVVIPLFIFPSLVHFLHQYLDAMLRKASSSRAANCDIFLAIIRLYQGLRIVGNEVDRCFRAVCTPAIIMFGTNLVILSLFVTIRFQDRIAMPAYLLFPFCGLNGPMYFLMMYSTAGFVNSVSQEVVGRLGRSAGFVNDGRRSYVLRMSWSLRPVRVCFGMNYFEKSTAFVVIMYCLNQTASLLMIKAV